MSSQPQGRGWNDHRRPPASHRAGEGCPPASHQCPAALSAPSPHLLSARCRAGGPGIRASA
eukprot:4230747-Prymnesium_polylepis.1